MKRVVSTIFNMDAVFVDATIIETEDPVQVRGIILRVEEEVEEDEFTTRKHDDVATKPSNTTEDNGMCGHPAERLLEVAC